MENWYGANGMTEDEQIPEQLRRRKLGSAGAVTHVQTLTVCQQLSHGRRKAVVVEMRAIPQKSKPKKSTKRDRRRKAKKTQSAIPIPGGLVKQPNTRPQRPAPLHRFQQLGPLSLLSSAPMAPSSDRYLQSAGMPGNEETDP